MPHFKVIRTYSQIGFPGIQARLYNNNGISYVEIPVGTVIQGAELVNNGTPFVGYLVLYKKDRLFVRSEDAIEI